MSKAAPSPRRALRLKVPGRALVMAVPYVWLLLFFLLPFVIILKISFATNALGVPPYTSLVSFADNALTVTLNLQSYAYLVTDELYIFAYANAVVAALVSTALCLLIGYPIAYGIARARGGWRLLLLMMVMLPFWTSFLIRVYAWIGILKENGLLNGLLIHLGLITQPLVILNTWTSVVIGIVYTYLPFMILPLFATLEKLDGALLEAAADLGARPATAFLRVTLPLSLPGIIAGSLLVFIPACGEYVIPSLLGGPSNFMIGNQLSTEFFGNRDWPTASAVAVVLTLLLVAPIIWFQRTQTETRAGAA